MKIATLSSVSFDGTGFTVTFIEGTPSIRPLGTVIGYAKREQKNAGRTPFDITEVPGGLYLRPATATTNTPEKLQEDALLYLECIGFQPAPPEDPSEESEQQERHRSSPLLIHALTATASQQLTA